MNMKKIFAGVAASALAVTSLATVASAAEVPVVVPAGPTYYASYTYAPKSEPLSALLRTKTAQAWYDEDKTQSKGEGRWELQLAPPTLAGYDVTGYSVTLTLYNMVSGATATAVKSAASGDVGYANGVTFAFTEAAVSPDDDYQFCNFPAKVKRNTNEADYNVTDYNVKLSYTINVETRDPKKAFDATVDKEKTFDIKVTSTEKAQALGNGVATISARSIGSVDNPSGAPADFAITPAGEPTKRWFENGPIYTAKNLTDVDLNTLNANGGKVIVTFTANDKLKDGEYAVITVDLKTFAEESEGKGGVRAQKLIYKNESVPVEVDITKGTLVSAADINNRTGYLPIFVNASKTSDNVSVSSVKIVWTGTSTTPGAKNDVNPDSNEKVITVENVTDTGAVRVIGTNSAIYGKADKLSVTNKLSATSLTYYLKLTDGGKDSNLAAPVTVEFTVPKNVKSGLTTITHYLNNGTKEELKIENATYKTDGFIRIITSSFSGFEIPLDEEETTTTTEAPVETTTEAPVETTTTAAPVTADKNTPSNPPTGVALVVIPAIAAAAGVIISKKRK